MKLKKRTHEEAKAYFEGFNLAIEIAARRLETANDETTRMCLIQAIRAMRQEPFRLVEPSRDEQSQGETK